MFVVKQTGVYRKWFADLRDLRAKSRIDVRIRRLEIGNPGRFEPVGDGVSEMKIDYGPGYRIYYKQTGETILLLLCGGDKASQARDIRAAKQLAKAAEDEK